MLPLVPFCQKTFSFARQPLHLETGRMARQSLASVVASSGACQVLCTVNVSHNPPASHVDFLPLSVHYLERPCSAGKIPGGFMKRESKPSDKEVLSARLIDRSLRPLFSHDFHHEIQVVCTVLSYDAKVDSALVALLGASAALGISGLPFSGPVAAVRVVCQDDQSFDLSLQAKEGLLDLVVAGTHSGILMVEGASQEVDESLIVQALEYGQNEIQEILEHLKDFIEKAKRPPFYYATHHETFEPFIRAMIHEGKEDWEEICHIRHTHDQGVALKRLKEKIFKNLEKTFENLSQETKENLFRKAWHSQARLFILSNKKRLDGRSFTDIRAISCEVGFLPSVHGSALFTRGMTQCLVSVTLAGKDEAQLVDDLAGSYRDSFLLHYNFPSYAVGEVGKMGATGRREIGHGKLGWRAFQAVLPPAKENHYTVRIVSDITESYGSSSMATVCGASLALVNAGFPLKRPVAGIAMGLVQDQTDQAVLSDISGSEDSLGDMDFKVTGTAQGLTALQMDVKGCILPSALLQKALQQAREGLNHILHAMESAKSSDRVGHQDSKPTYLSYHIPTEKIGLLIGPGGRTIREISDTYRTKIDVQSSGSVSIFSASGKQPALATLERIKEIIMR